MKKYVVILFSAILVVALAGCQNNGKQNSSSNENDSVTVDLSKDASEEAKLYNQKCSSCHGENLEGAVGPELSKIGNVMSKEEIEKIIVDGSGAMPSGLLVGDQATQMAEWLTQFK